MAESPLPLAMHLILDGSPSGGSTVVLGVCLDLHRKGWRTLIVCPLGSYLLHAAKAAGIAVHGVSFEKYRISPSAVRHTRRLVKEHRPTLVHAHGARAGLPLALLSLIGIAPPIVYTVHGFHFVFKPWLARALGALAEKFMAARSAAVIYVSSDDLALAKRWRIAPRDASRLMLIHNGVDPSELDTVAIQTKRFDLVFLGRLVPQKNPWLFLHIVKALEASGISAAVVGGGALEEPLRQWAAQAGLGKSVDFFGALPRREALEVLTASRLCVFPSRWEGFPIAPIEASYFGVPTIASNIPGTREVVQDGLNGILVDSADPEPYAECIRAALQNPRSLKEMGQAGQEMVRRHFVREHSSDAYAAVYSRLIDANHRPVSRISKSPFPNHHD